MWYHTLQVLLVVAAIVISLCVRYALIDHQADLPRLHRIYLLQTIPAKTLRHYTVRGTWLAVLLVTVGTLASCENASQPSFHPTGDFLWRKQKHKPSPHQLQRKFITRFMVGSAL